jgi:hypothetical protein
MTRAWNRLAVRIYPICGVLVMAVALAAPRLALADDPAAKKTAAAPKPVELVIEPAAEPVPALKHHLLVPADERIEGNAAPIYARLVHEQNDAWRKQLGNESSRLLEVPAEKLSLDEVGKFLKTFATTSEQLAAAARRSECDWEYVTEGQDPVMILLPDAQYLRNYARLLALETRYHARSGEPAQAIDSLRAGLALSQNAASAPFLVNQLIGAAIGGVMLAEIDTLVQQPGAPNLYWALAELPRPLASLRQGAATECRVLEMKFPALAHLDDPRLRPDWPQLSRALRDWARELVRQDSGIAGAVERIGRIEAAPSEAQLDTARAYLRDTSKRSAEEVQAMSPAEVEVRYTVALFAEIGDAWRKWFLTPYPQALPQLKERCELLGQEAKRRELIPLLSLLMPLHATLLAAQARGDRQVARAQAIEALRMHAAATGKLPEKLADVQVVPVPLDPVTGGPFEYKLEGDVATLDASGATDADREAVRLPVRIRLRGK